MPYQLLLPYTVISPFNCVEVGEARAANAKIIMIGNIELAMSHVLPDLIQKVLKEQNSLRILGDRKQIRNLTYGGVLAKGIGTTPENPRALNEDFNTSADESITIFKMAEKIWLKIKSSEVQFKYITDEPFPHDVQKRILDTSKAKILLGFMA